MSYLLRKEIRKIQSSPFMFLFIMLGFLVLPNLARDFYLGQYPFRVLTDITQPYRIEKTLVEVGEVNGYYVEATKNYDFASTIDRRMISDECNAESQISDNVASNQPKGLLEGNIVKFRIPELTQTDCEYYLQIAITYNTGKRNLEPIVLRTETFKAVANKEKYLIEQKIKEVQKDIDKLQGVI